MTYNLYKILGLDKNDNPSEDNIKKAYKKMAMLYHPDKNKDNPNAEEKFKEISNACDILTDEKKKRIYDQVGDEGFKEAESSGGNFHGNHADIFESFFGGRHPFAHHFGFDFGESFENRNKHQNSIHKQIHLTLEDVFNGVNKELNLTINKYCHDCLTKCVNCNGTGVVKQVKNMGIMTQIFTGRCDKCNDGFKSNGNKSCGVCNGKGKYSKDVNAHLSLPKGVHTGYKTVFPEMGEQPKNPDQVPGNLILEVIVSDHSIYQRDGNDLIYKCQLSYIESVIGKDIKIPFFNNKTLELNTSIFGVVYPGKKYLIQNKGLPILNTESYGNMYIEFSIKYPKIKNKDKIKELELLLQETFDTN